MPPPGGGSPIRHPFLYVAEIEALGLPPGANSGTVGGLNDRGQAAVNFRFAGDVSRPYLYSGGMTAPIALPAGFTGGSGNGINNLGHVAGGLAGAAGGGRPFVFADGVLTVLDLPPAASLGGSAVGINDRGQVLGIYSSQSGGAFYNHAVLWSGGTMAELAPPAGFDSVTAVAVNAPGHVAGYMTGPVPGVPGGRVIRPFLYRDGVMNVMADPLFSGNTTVTGMNDLDEYVGSALRGLTTHGYVYADGGYVNLTETVTLPDGFTITDAIDINNAGQILACARNPEGERRTFVLTPVPEPGALAGALVIGASALLGRRRARAK